MSDPAGDSPIGIIGNDEHGAAIAQRIAACGYGTLYAALPGSPRIRRGANSRAFADAD